MRLRRPHSFALAQTHSPKRCRNLRLGGGYEQFENSEGGTLTVSARVSSGSPRHAMPSMGFADFDYAALLYKDGEISANLESKDFVQGTATEDGKLIFSFQRPDDTDGTFTLELFAFVKTEEGAEDDTMQFSRETALLSGNKTGLSIVGDTIEISEAIPLSSSKPGTVSLKIKVPEGCSLEIDDTTSDGESRFNVAGTSPDFTVTQIGDGIPADAYQVKFTVKKSGEVVYIFSECINVFNGMHTDRWDGLEKDAAKEITQNMIFSTVYVRGTGDGYYETSPYKDTATASDENSGSFLSPLASIQKAIDKIIAINDGSSAYTIYVDGTLDGMTAAKLGDNGMADFINLNKNLNLTIKTLSSTATLDAGARLDSDGTATVEGIGKRVIYAKPAYGTLNLTLENLTITGGNSSEEGGGIYVYGGTLDMKNCKVEGNITKGYRGSGILVVSGGNVIMDGGTISRNEVRGATSSNQNYGGGVYVSSGRFTMKGDAIISENILAVADDATSRYGGNVYVQTATFEMEGGTISGGNAKYGAGVYVYSGEFTMKGGEISGGNANSYGGGVCVALYGTFTMTGGIISGNNANNYGGGVYVNGEFTMNNGTISGGTGAYGGGVYVDKGAFMMNGGTISDCTAKYGGGGIYNVGTLTIESGTKISGCESGTWGGGIYNGGTGTAVINGCTIESCKAKGDSSNVGGGGIFSAGTLTVTGGTIYKCSAESKGGGLFLNGSQCTVAGVTISECTATYGGGVGFYINAIFTMEDGTIISKNTAQAGGGVYVNGSSTSGNTFTMTGGTISENTAQRGGGVYITGTESTFTMTDGTITGNTTYYGGGVYVTGSTFTMEDGEINNNNANSFGGGVYLSSNGTFMMKGGTISDCTAGLGGGVSIGSTSTLEMSGTAKIAGCKKTSTNTNSGGGIYNEGTFTIGGEACIPVGEDGKNDVYIVSGKAITVASDLTAPSPVATINPSAYTAGSQVLSAGDGVTIDDAVCGKFAVTPQNDTGWRVAPNGDGTAGVLEILDAIYLDSSNGDDTNSGLTASKAVKTLSKAIDLFDSQYAKKIIVCAAYTLPSGERGILDRMGGGKRNLPLVRYDGSSDVSDGFFGILLEINQGNVTITNVTFDGNKEKISANNPLLSIEGSTTTVTLGDGVTVCNNYNNTTFGGGIYVSDGTLTMDNCTVSENGTISKGGGIFACNSAKVTLTNCTIKSCETTSEGSGTGGGGIYNENATIEIEGGEISDCSAGRTGGGIYNYSGTLSVSGCSFLRCKTIANSGGGICNSSDCIATVTDCSFTSCVAKLQGGGIRNAGTLTISNVTYSECVAGNGNANLYNVGTLNP